MTLNIKVSAALAGYSLKEQSKILSAIETGQHLDTARLYEGALKVKAVYEEWEPAVEGYAGFPVDRDEVKKKKDQHDDRNVGRVIQSKGQSYVITGKKADGRYIVVGKKGDKTAKEAGDIGLNMQRETVGIDIEDLHQQMLEGMKQARKNVGASKCWDGYKAKGTKTKGGKQVPNCVKEEELDEIYKGKHGQSEKEYQDSRSDGGKMVSGDSKHSGAAYSSRAVKNTGPNPAGGSKKPQGQGRMTSGQRTELQYRKANLKKKNEEFINKLSASGLFSEAELKQMEEME